MKTTKASQERKKEIEDSLSHSRPPTNARKSHPNKKTTKIRWEKEREERGYYWNLKIDMAGNHPTTTQNPSSSGKEKGDGRGLQAPSIASDLCSLASLVRSDEHDDAIDQSDDPSHSHQSERVAIVVSDSTEVFSLLLDLVSDDAHADETSDTTTDGQEGDEVAESSLLAGADEDAEEQSHEVAQDGNDTESLSGLEVVALGASHFSAIKRGVTLQLASFVVSRDGISNGWGQLNGEDSSFGLATSSRVSEPSGGGEGDDAEEGGHEDEEDGDTLRQSHVCEVGEG